MAENGERLRPAQPLARTRISELDWGGACVEAVLAARARGLRGFEIGAWRGAWTGGVIGFGLGILGAVARGQNGRWGDVAVQFSYGLVLLSFAGALVGTISGSLIAAVGSGLLGGFSTLRAYYGMRRQYLSRSTPERESRLEPRAVPSQPVVHSPSLQPSQTPDLALSDPDLR
jgi:hypothetical protein